MFWQTATRQSRRWATMSDARHVILVIIMLQAAEGTVIMVEDRS